MVKIMEKPYDSEAVDKLVESLWDELEPKIVKVIIDSSVGFFPWFKLPAGVDQTKMTLDELSAFFPMFGFYIFVEGAQKLVLERDYGIKWLSPSELYPDIIFD